VRYGLRAEVAAEYDSNPAASSEVAGEPRARDEIPARRWGAVLPGTCDRRWDRGSASSLSEPWPASCSRAPRPDEDVVVGEASGTLERAGGRATTVGLVGTYAEVFQRPEHRGARLPLRARPTALRAGGGARAGC
jgi:hypothetical protein